MATSGKKIFRFMWLDASIFDERGKETQHQLCHNFGRCKFVETTKECQTTIDKSMPDTNFVLIVSGQLGSQIVPLIYENSKIWSIYVYCGNVDEHKKWANNYPKVKCFLILSIFIIISFNQVKYVTNNLDELIERIKADQRKS